ncbi:MAG: hypothetical protein LUH19_08260 [Lachnospiraceae bacterium]|nr:hypothetical protein [Lachnospiraceae bacterium]
MADCCITFSVVLLIIFILFRYDSTDLDYIIPGQKEEKNTGND